MNTSVSNTDEYLATLPEWQQKNLSQFRAIIHDAIPEVTEEIKWNVPTFFSGKKMMFAMSAFKAHTKFNFIFNGASLKDENKLFNNGLESSKARAIDLKEGEEISSEHLKALVQESVTL